jgi:hypothetical protein
VPKGVRVRVSPWLQKFFIMAKWWENTKRVNVSKNNKRFLTSFDMAEAKRMESILNSEIKRGVRPVEGNMRHVICTCGVSGCIFCVTYSNR